jgi:nucleoside-diphosphate-sugar epimerase
MIKNVRILITGGAGFIGSHLCRVLASENVVVCMDNLVTGNMRNIKNSNIEFVKHDITKSFLDKIEKADLIFNLACPASPVDYGNLPNETLLTNSAGMHNVLEASRKWNAKVLQASSSEVYGDPTVHPQREDYWGNVNPVGPRSCYDEGKRFAEALCMSYFRKFKTNVVIARIFNTYGEYMQIDDGRVIPNFISQALKNEPITVYGNGEQTRSFCYVSDMVSGLCGLMFSDTAGEIFNVGNPDEYKVIEIAKKIKEICKSSSKIVFRELPKDDPTKRKPDISKIKKKLNWSPKVGFDEGIKKTIGYFKKVIQ